MPRRTKSLAASAALALACGGLTFAQTAQFEVASVKPAAPDSRGMRCAGGPGTSDPGSLNCENYSLSFLVMMSYNLRGFQLSAPGWMDTARFDVVAKIPPGADTQQFRLMQQRLLAERFGLKVHFEKRDATVYDLTVSKSGAKFKESQEPAAAKPAAAWRPPAGGPPKTTMAHVNLKGESVAELANFLSNQLGQPVLDATGRDGRYDFAFSFLMEPGGRAAGPGVSNNVSNGSEPEFGISLIDAVRDQLGLRLEKKRGQVDVLVVDHAERLPIEN
jgi:uncharacterized protein (TIGR03435 family)